MDNLDRCTWVGGKQGVYLVKAAYKYLQNHQLSSITYHNSPYLGSFGK